MTTHVLVVEDDPLIAMDLQAIIEGYGFAPVGPASTKSEALAYADQADLALVDVNLADGATGPSIAHILWDEYGITALFLTANPEMVTDSHTGAIGVVAKPHSAIEVTEALEYALAARKGSMLPRPLFVQPLSAE